MAGTILQEMLTRGIDAPSAVDRLIDAAGLLRLNGLGTVINRL